MNENILHTVYLAGVFLILFASAELLYHKFKVKAEITRNYVHIVTGLLTMLFPLLIENNWLVMALCGSFLIILLISQNLNLLPSINAVDRETIGSILYPIIVYSCYFIYKKYDHLLFYYIPILTLAICDPVAALVGKSWPVGRYKIFGQTKTLSGSFGFFISALITCSCLILGLEETPFKEAILISLSVALVTSFAEALNYKGFDNISIPAGALVVLMLFNNYYSLG